MNTHTGQASRWPRALAPCAVLLVGLVTTSLVALALARDARTRDKQRFDEAVYQIEQLLDTKLERYETGLANLQEFFNLKEAVTESEWRMRLQRWAPAVNYPGLIEVGFAHYLDGAPWRREPPEWIMTPPHLRTEPSSSTNEVAKGLYPVLFHYAAAGWPGMPYGAELIQLYPGDWADNARTVQRTFESDAATVSRRKRSRDSSGKREVSAITLYLPVFQTNLVGASRNVLSRVFQLAARSRVDQVKGLVFATYAVDDLFRSLFGSEPKAVAFEWFSSPRPEREAWLNDGSGSMRFGDSAPRPSLSLVRANRCYGDDWSLHFYTTPLFDAQSPRYRARLAGAVGVPLSLLLAGITWTQARGRAKAERLASSLQQSEARLQVALRDRERLSRDLHDGAIQSIYAVGLGLNRCRALLRQDPHTAEAQLQSSLEQLHEVVVEMRQFILGLEADARGGHRLDEVLQTLVERWRSGTDTRLELTADVSATACLDAPQTIHLLNIAREAISNSLQHARAREVRVSFTRKNGHGRLEVRDDGAGFIVTAQAKGHGLLNLAVRAEDLGGKLIVQSEPGRGTMVAVELPLKPGELTAELGEGRVAEGI